MTYQASPKMTVNQEQLIAGTVLGGSSIIDPAHGKNCYLSMRDSDQNWLMYKVEYLAPFFKMDENVVRKDGATYRSFTTAYPIFNTLHRRFYKEGQKTVTKEVLENLNDLAWMVWFVDAGKMTGHEIVLRINKFSPESSKLIVDYFNSLNCSCTISKKGDKVTFDNAGSQEFLKIISHRMPKFIQEQFG